VASAKGKAAVKSAAWMVTRRPQPASRTRRVAVRRISGSASTASIVTSARAATRTSV